MTDQIETLIVGLVALVFGLHAVITKRVQFGDKRDDLQIWLYGWRAVLIGCMVLIVAAVLLASAAGLISIDWQ